MRGEIADQDVRQRLVIVGVLVLPVQAFFPGFTAPDGSAVLIDGVIALAFAAHIMRFWLRLLVLGSYKAALDTDGAVMVEDDEGSATRDVGGVIGLTLGLQPLDLGLKLTEARIDFGGQFLVVLMLLRQAIELAPHGSQGGLIFRRQVHCLRISPA
jgi:hypothetical protein